MSEAERAREAEGGLAPGEGARGAEAEGGASTPAQEAPSVPAAEPVAAPAPTPEPERPRVRPSRQWVTLYKSSLDLRVGEGLLEKVGRDLKSLAGKPRAAVLACAPSCPADVSLGLSRRLVESGFDVREAALPEGEAGLQLDGAAALLRALAGLGVTGDDVMCAVGDAAALSVASLAAGSWCGGIALAMVPADLDAAVECGVTPRALDVGEARAVVSRPSAARILYADLDALGDVAAPTEANLLARALMVQSAVVDGEKPFSHLWDRAEDVAEGVPGELCPQITETVKSRGRTVSSTSVATRQSVAYGVCVARALRSLLPAEPASTCLAEALRLTARIGVACSGFSADDMLAQDELLEMLGLPLLGEAPEPEALAAAIRQECFRTGNKFMVLVPQALGRVRLWAADDAVLLEHARAWCASRERLG